MSSKVFFTDMHVRMGDSLLRKFERLITAAGIDQIDFEGKFVAIKLHFGEVGNMAFLRQQYAKVLCDHIKKRGGKPFLTDCNTLYVGYRNNALNHLDAAYMNGYNPLATGVHTIIADGLRGTDERLIPVVGGEYVKEAKIGAAIAEADIIISLSHFKGHINAGFGGALKNIGMGCGSVAGKKEMHSCSKPKINQDNCVGCGICVSNCAHDAVHLNAERKAFIDPDRCMGCGQCVAACQHEAAVADNDEQLDILNCKIAEYAKAVLQGKPHFHIGIIVDVSPECDCWNYNDAPIVPNIGMLASFDPVALDCAAADLVNHTPILSSENALTAKHTHEECEHDHDHWDLLHPDTNWKSCVAHAEKIGIGSRKYELVRM